MELIIVVVAWIVFSLVRSQIREGSGRGIPRKEDSAAYQNLSRSYSEETSNRTGKSAKAPSTFSEEKTKTSDSNESLPPKPKKMRQSQDFRPEKSALGGSSLFDSELSARDVQLGIIMSEVLGPPRSERPYHPLGE